MISSNTDVFSWRRSHNKFFKVVVIILILVVDKFSYKGTLFNFRGKRFLWSSENHEIPVKNHLKVKSRKEDSSILQSKWDKHHWCLLLCFDITRSVTVLYKLKPPANSKFSLFPLRSFLHYITIDNSSCFERVASRNSVRTAIQKK